MIFATHYVKKNSNTKSKFWFNYTLFWMSSYMLAWIEGEDGGICGNTTQNNAAVKQAGLSKWSADWQKSRTDATELTDIRCMKFNGCNNRQTVIDSMYKNEEGKYRDFLGEESNRNICKLFLQIFSDCLHLQTYEGTFESLHKPQKYRNKK